MDGAKDKWNHILLVKKDKYFQGVSHKDENHYQESEKAPARSDLKMDINFNKCCFCTKVFSSSKFLIQHILRRHSENLVVLYKKLNDACSEKNSFNQTDLNNILNDLKKDLDIIKSAVTVNGKCAPDCHKVSAKESHFQEDFTDIADKVSSLHTMLQSLKTNVESVEFDVKNLKRETRECSTSDIYNGENIKNTMIYKTLKDNILLEVKNVVLENSKKEREIWNEHISNLKADVKKLEGMIQLNSEKYDSQSLAQEVMKSLENEVAVFLNNRKARKFNAHKKSSNRIQKNQLATSDGNLKTCLTKMHKPNSNYKIADFRNSKGLLLLEKKLNAFNVFPGTKKMPCSDYHSKLKLVDSERDMLSKKYQSFSEVREQLNSSTDNIVSKKLKSKPAKELRFDLSSNQSNCKFLETAKTSQDEFFKQKMPPCSLISTTHNTEDNNIAWSDVPDTKSSNPVNSAASLKLISSCHKRRQLPRLPVSPTEELSAYVSLESDG